MLTVLNVIVDILYDWATLEVTRQRVRVKAGFTLKAAWDCDMLIFDQDE